MSERFTEDSVVQTSGQEDGVNVTQEIAEISAEVEELQSGIMSRINRMLSRHKKIVNTIGAFLFYFDLIGVVKYGSDEVTHALRGDLPEIKRQIPGDLPSPDKFELLQDVMVETGREPAQMMIIDSVKTPQERAEVVGLPNETRISGFENFVISNETVQAILEKTLPKGFMRNVDSIVYVSRDDYLQSSYGMGADSKNESGVAGTAYTRKRRIEIMKEAAEDSKSWIAHDLILHEVFHLEDPFTNRLLTVDERIDLYKKILDRVKSPDRFKSSYVEAIKNDDKKLELSNKVAEYFAEIGSTYLSPEYYQLPEADKELIKDFIAKIDPEFDRVKALNIRRELIGQKIVIDKVFSLEELTEVYMRNVVSVEKAREAYKDAFIRHGIPFSEEQLDEAAQEWHDESVKSIKEAAERVYKSQFEYWDHMRKIYRGER